MGKNCCVPKCRSQTGIKNGSESMKGMFSMHVFPSDPDLRNAWIRNVGRPNWEPTPNSTICSLHFEENNYLGAKYLVFSPLIPSKREQNILVLLRLHIF